MSTPTDRPVVPAPLHAHPEAAGSRAQDLLCP